MSAAQIINELKTLGESERAEVVKWILDNDDEAFFAWADAQPIDRTMTEEEILALPRVIPQDPRPSR